MAFDDSLLDILACPQSTCRARLRRDADRLVCTGCGLRYPIRENWVELIPEEAEGPDVTEAGNADRFNPDPHQTPS